MTTRAKRKPWLAEHDQFLIDNYVFMTNEEMAHLLGYHISTINRKKKELGLTGKKPIYEVFKGYELIATGTIEECAAQLGKKPETISFYTTEHHMRRIDSLENGIVAFRVE